MILTHRQIDLLGKLAFHEAANQEVSVETVRDRSRGLVHVEWRRRTDPSARTRYYLNSEGVLLDPLTAAEVPYRINAV